MTQARRESYVNRYFNSNATRLWDVYKNWSHAKEDAFWAIEEEMFLNNGYDIRITSYNSQIFTCAYRMRKGDFEVLVIHTPTTRDSIVL